MPSRTFGDHFVAEFISPKHEHLYAKFFFEVSIIITTTFVFICIFRQSGCSTAACTHRFPFIIAIPFVIGCLWLLPHLSLHHSRSETVNIMGVPRPDRIAESTTLRSWDCCAPSSVFTFICYKFSGKFSSANHQTLVVPLPSSKCQFGAILGYSGVYSTESRTFTWLTPSEWALGGSWIV
eukprot:Filipodium_phascolosomae@DN2975_c0_g1_i1.p1